jgi:hypothetical protein
MARSGESRYYPGSRLVPTVPAINKLFVRIAAGERQLVAAKISQIRDQFDQSRFQPAAMASLAAVSPVFR